MCRYTGTRHAVLRVVVEVKFLGAKKHRTVGHESKVLRVLSRHHL